MAQVAIRKHWLGIILVAAVVVLAGGLWALRHGAAPEGSAPAPVPVRVEGARVEDLKRTLSLNGWVDATDTVSVVPKVSGTLVSLSADVGDAVSAGQVLGVVDPEPYRLALEQARISKDAAKAELDRAAALYESGSAGKQAYDQAKAKSESADAQYDLADLNYRNTRIVAPVGGTVVKRVSVRGAPVSPGTPVVAIDASRTPLVVVQVPERYIVPFLRGEVREASVSSPGAGLSALAAAITRVAPYVKSENRSFEVTCAVTAPGGAGVLVPGMFVELRFTLQERDAVPTLPDSALVGDTRLWMLDRATMTASSVAVADPFGDGKRFEVPAEYADREFLVQGQNFLTEGAAVRVLGE